MDCGSRMCLSGDQMRRLREGSWDLANQYAWGFSPSYTWERIQGKLRRL